MSAPDRPETGDRPTPPAADHGPEAALEPVGLIRQSGTVLRTGTAMLAAGTGSYRVKKAMRQVAAAVGLDRHHAQVTLTEITATSHRGPIFRTEVAEIRAVGVDAHRLTELTHLCDGLRPGATPDDVDAELYRIAALRPLHGALANALFAGVACGAFAFLNNGGVVEVLGVLVAATLGQLVRRALVHRGVNQLAVTMLAAAVACAVYLGGVLTLAAAGGVDPGHEAGYVSAVLFLVPGFALVTGALDLARLDLSAGVARLVHAGVVLVSAGLSVWAVSWVSGQAPTEIPAFDLPLAVEVAARAVASGLGVLGFALLFNSPWRLATAAAGIGLVANVLRLQLADADVAPQAATMLATLLVGLLAAWIAPRLRVPRITLSVPAVVIMVPGAAVYRAIVAVNDGSTDVAVAATVQATFVVISIAIGLAAARMLTDRAWAFER